jgi:hypothetical protein
VAKHKPAEQSCMPRESSRIYSLHLLDPLLDLTILL